MRSALASPLTALIGVSTAPARRAIARTLQRFGARALAFAVHGGVRVIALHPDQGYADASRAIRQLRICVDAWPAPPAGLFVVEERTVYLRSLSAMTVAHEFGHALDCVLGGGTYRSSLDPRVRRAFESAHTYVTPYAATGLDEYFAESLRAFVDANDRDSSWPRATPARLAALDPAMYAYVSELFTSVF